MTDLSDHFAYHRSQVCDDDLYGWLRGVAEEESPPWMLKAACRGMDPNLFFTERGDNEANAQAKLLCEGCPVRLDCLEYGLGEREGVWGGLSARQRRKLRVGRSKLRQVVPGGCGTNEGWERHQAKGEEPCARCSMAHRSSGHA